MRGLVVGVDEGEALIAADEAERVGGGGFAGDDGLPVGDGLLTEDVDGAGEIGPGEGGDDDGDGGRGGAAGGGCGGGGVGDGVVIARSRRA